MTPSPERQAAGRCDAAALGAIRRFFSLDTCIAASLHRTDLTHAETLAMWRKA